MESDWLLAQRLRVADVAVDELLEGELLAGSKAPAMLHRAKHNGTSNSILSLRQAKVMHPGKRARST
jgi:hypothetical protein